MDNIKKWCSNRENIKILIMIGMAIVLIVVLKIRFGEKTVTTSDSSAARYQTGGETLTQDSGMVNNTNVPEREPAPFKKVMFNSLKPPPFLKRDLFSYRNPETNPKRKSEQLEEPKLELTATLIDGEGVLAIIGSEVLGIGESVNGFEVRAIKNNEVILSKGGNQFILRINEE